MTYRNSLYILCFFSNLLLADLLYAQTPSKDIIIWQENRPLTLSDYKVVSDKTKSLRPKVAAITRTGITYSFSSEKNSTNTANITVNFYATVHKPHSVIKQKVLNLSPRRQKDLIDHEQRHFDISEIFARRATQALGHIFLKKNYASQIKDLMKKVFSEAEDYQYLYDRETANGENEAAQEIWDKKILNGLNRLKQYKSKVVKRTVLIK